MSNGRYEFRTPSFRPIINILEALYETSSFTNTRFLGSTLISNTNWYYRYLYKANIVWLKSIKPYVQKYVSLPLQLIGIYYILYLLGSLTDVGRTIQKCLFQGWRAKSCVERHVVLRGYCNVGNFEYLSQLIRSH